MNTTLRRLPDNSRFYILLCAFLLSIFVFSWLRLQIPGEQLFLIRTEQAFGFIAIALWYVALIIAPLCKVIGQPLWMQYLLFARRAIGVSAAYFALLHGVVATWGQLGGLSGLGQLPALFQIALWLGGFGTVVLAAMAVTSFDKMVALLTFRRWKILHRFSYPAGIAVIAHVWLVGTHAATPLVQWSGFIALSVLFGLEAIRVARTLAKKYSKLPVRLVAIVIWLAASSLLYSMPNWVANYHTLHHASQEGAAHE